jgi:hypothetical protein
MIGKMIQFWVTAKSCTMLAYGGTIHVSPVIVPAASAV